jgi:hypothetical protein
LGFGEMPLVRALQAIQQMKAQQEHGERIDGDNGQEEKS